MTYLLKNRIDFNAYFDKRYSFAETYFIAGLCVKIMTHDRSVYNAINEAYLVKVIDKNQPDVTIILDSTPDLSHVVTNISKSTDWQTISKDFSISEHSNQRYNIIYVKYGRETKALFAASLFSKNRILIFIANDALPRSCRFSLITILLNYLMKARNIFALHAAYMTKNRANILFPGKSGCGKTTLAINLIKSGFICRSDDISFLSGSKSKVKAYSFPKRILEVDFKANKKIKVKHKNFYYRTPSTPNFIIFPHISAVRNSVLMNLSPNEAMMKIIDSFMFSFKADKDRYVKNIKLLKKLIAQCRCYSLISGRDIMKSPHKLHIIMQRLSLKGKPI